MIASEIFKGVSVLQGCACAFHERLQRRTSRRCRCLAEPSAIPPETSEHGGKVSTSNALVEAVVRGLLPVVLAPEQGRAFALESVGNPGVAVGGALEWDVSTFDQDT